MTTSGDTTIRRLMAASAGTLLALALLPMCWAIGVPLSAWLIAFALVVANRAVHHLVAWSVRDSSMTTQLGALGFSTIFRALLTTLTLFFVGAQVAAGGDRPIGLNRPDLARSALIIFILCFTLDTGIETIRRASQRAELDTKSTAMEYTA